MKDNGYWPAIRDSQLWKLKQSSICKSYFLRLVVHKSAHHYFDGKSKEFRESGLLRVHFHLVSRGILVCVCLGGLPGLVCTEKLRFVCQVITFWLSSVWVRPKRAPPTPPLCDLLCVGMSA